MVKDLKYIIKRIIIGVGIAIVLMLLKGTFLIGVHAKELSSHNWGYQYIGATTNSQYSDFTINGNPWANWRLGTLYFTIAVTKTTGSATDPVLGVRSIYAMSDTSVYTCYFGANTSTNSTWTETTYSVQCPMDLGWPGVTKVRITFNPIGQQTTSSYIVTLDEYATFEQDDSVTLNVDTSGTTSAINNQITNDNTNTTNIINNQNQNTQQQIESQKVCLNRLLVSSDYIFDNTYVNSNGTLTSYSGYFSTDYLEINSFEVNEQLASGIIYTCFYKQDKSLISCKSWSQTPVGVVSLPNDTFYARFSARKSDNLPKFFVGICKKGNQAIADGQQQINDTLNDDSGVADSDISDLFGDFEESDTPISDLLLMPLTLIQAYINGMSGTCSPVNLGNLYGTDLILPCINLENRLGSNLWSIIDGLISIFMIYNLSQLFISAFDGITSLRDGFDELYTPKHRDYIPKHGG